MSYVRIKNILAVVIVQAIAFILLAAPVDAAKCVVNRAYPDKTCTPGVALKVTAAQICTPGYSKSVRNVIESVKNAVFAEYGITSHPTGAYEIDHFISLELGGSNDIRNLFPEAAKPTPGFHEKDAVENYLHAQVCAGKMTLAAAQKKISTDLVATYKHDLQKTTAKTTTIKSTVKSLTTTAKARTTTKAPVVVSDPAVKMSNSGICHAKGTTYYVQTKNFTAYASVKACLAAGGRLPK